MSTTKIMFLTVFASKVFAVGIAASLSWWWVAALFALVHVATFIKLLVTGAVQGFASQVVEDNSGNLVAQGVIQKK